MKGVFIFILLSLLALQSKAAITPPLDLGFSLKQGRGDISDLLLVPISYATFTGLAYLEDSLKIPDRGHHFYAMEGQLLLGMAALCTQTFLLKQDVQFNRVLGGVLGTTAGFSFNF